MMGKVFFFFLHLSFQVGLLVAFNYFLQDVESDDSDPSGYCEFFSYKLLIP